jgi:hypothetical protein
MKMGVDQSRRVRLFVHDGVGAGIVFEKSDDGDRFPVHIADGPDAARLWVDGHYDDVDWVSPRRAAATISAGSEPARLSPTSTETRPWEHRPLTYETGELRAYLPELLAGARGHVILQQCEEYVPESDRWEPFVSILWESSW